MKSLEISSCFAVDVATQLLGCFTANLGNLTTLDLINVHEMTSDASPRWASSAIDVLSGIFGAACLVASGNPFDTAKVRLQTQPGRYSNSFMCIARMAREEGIASLWKGASPALASAVIENAVVFSANGALRRFTASSVHSGDEARITAAEQALIGGAAGVLSSTGICPAEVVKCRMQYQGSNTAAGATAASAANAASPPPRLYRSTAHALASIVRTEGPRALFSGLPALWARDIPFNAVFLGSYRLHCVLLSEAVLGTAAPAHEAIPGWMALAAGSLAGATAWGVVYPFDVLKSRAQVAGMAAAQAAASAAAQGAAASTRSAVVAGPSMLPLLASIVREGGLRALYAGASAAVARGAVANGALFWGQNAATKALRAVMPGAAGDV